MKRSYNIQNDFIVLNSNKDAFVEKCDEGLYSRLDKSYNNFVDCELVSCHEFDADWSSWEMHPHGDELVMLLSGRVDFVLDIDDVHSVVNLAAQGEYVIVPRGVWHTARTSEKSKVLFVTPGQDTLHKSKD